MLVKALQIFYPRYRFGSIELLEVVSVVRLLDVFITMNFNEYHPLDVYK
jgi:hypothetical protein